MIDKIYGVDISHFQGNVNFQILSAPPNYPPNRFCMIRTGGAYTGAGMYKDKRLDEYIEKAPAHFEVIGLYFFFVPRLSRADAIAQADKFVELIQGKPWDFLAVDVEAQPWGYKVSQATFQEYLKAFLDRVEVLTGVKCVIYTRASFWNPNVGAPAWANKYSLFVARYANLAGPWSDGYYIPLPWGNSGPDAWAIWQFSADNPKNYLGATFGVSSESIDRDVFHGTWEEFEEWVRQYGRYDPEPPVEPPVEPPADVLDRLEALEGQIVVIDGRLDALEKQLADVAGPIREALAAWEKPE